MHIHYIRGRGVFQEILNNLSFPNAVLRHDQWHSMNQIFPKQFGPTTWSKIEKIVDNMLKATTVEGWDRCYHQAKDCLGMNASAISDLNSIHD